MFLFIATNVALVAQAIHFHPQLPARMATHFDLSGTVDGWMSRGSFLWSGAALLAVLDGVFVALLIALPRLPDAAINLPHPDYWLAPEHRAETIQWIGDWLLCFATSTLALLAMVAQGLYATNVARTYRLDGSVKWLITGFGAFALVQIASFVRRFSARPKPAGGIPRSRRRE